MARLKSTVFQDETRYRTVKAGLLQGVEIPINRRRNIRLELGLYEIGIARSFRRMVRGCKVGYDIGSANGYYTLAMLKRGVQTVVAFDPNEERQASLAESVARNGFSTGAVLPHRGFVGARVEPPFDTIDHLVQEGRLPSPDFVKMDIDGGELDALKGMAETLSRSRPGVILEVHSVPLEEDCARFLGESGYRVEVADNPPLLRKVLPEDRTGHNRWLVAEPRR